MRGISRRSPGALWAYAYLIVPPQPRSRLERIGAIIDGENLSAEGEARIWTGRLVLERRITHILVVSDSPEQSRAVNRHLEAELTRIGADFSLTTPMEIPGDREAVAVARSRGGNGRSTRLCLGPRSGE